MERNVLVIGGGIAGITCSLELAANGVKVTLIEQGPSIGGRMIQLDKTFPTLDCSSCILTPKMAEVSTNRSIELLTLSTVMEIERKGDGFSATILSNPRYVDMEKCSTCGACASACVMKVPDEFNFNLGKRSAIYIPFPQAVPQKYLVDRNACLFLSRGKCKKSCLDACEHKAINFEEKDRLIKRDFSAIVIATGFDLFDAASLGEYGMRKRRGVITSAELERILSPTGPTNGEILIEGKKPERFFFVQCVGSRDSQRGVKYCSRICCMYTAKHAYMIKEKLKDASIYVSYIDVRAYGKGYEEFFRSVQELGVLYIKGIPGEIVERGGSLLVRVEDMLSGELREIEVDVVVLATGILPSRDIFRIGKMLGLDLDEYGFVKVDPTYPSLAGKEGVFVCGTASGPKDIPDTVAQSTEAAASVFEYICRGK